MICIDEIWLSTQSMDMRAGMDTAMAQIMKAFGSIKPHCAYLFQPPGTQPDAQSIMEVQDYAINSCTALLLRHYNYERPH